MEPGGTAEALLRVTLGVLPSLEFPKEENKRQESFKHNSTNTSKIRTFKIT